MYFRLQRYENLENAAKRSNRIVILWRLQLVSISFNGTSDGILVEWCRSVS